MELSQRFIHMDHIRKKTMAQVVLEDDVTLQDQGLSAGAYICDNASIRLEDISTIADYVHVKGKLQYEILYLSDDEIPVPCRLKNTLPFDEQLYLEGVKSGEKVEVTAWKEDLKVNIIHPRKFGIRAIINFSVVMEELQDNKVTTGTPEELVIEARNEERKIAEIAVDMSDVLRLKEDVVLPSNLPNIMNVIWEGVRIDNFSFQTADDKIILQGDIYAFFMYEGDSDSYRISTYETTIPFSKTLEISGAESKMYGSVSIISTNYDISVGRDSDMEERIFEVDINLPLKIRLYKESELTYLTDAYGITTDITVSEKQMPVWSVLTSDDGKFYVDGSIELKNTEYQPQQILFKQAIPFLDKTEITENNINLEGHLEITIIYSTTDEKMPVNAAVGSLLFEENLPAEGVSGDDRVFVNLQPGTLMVSVLNGNSAEVKATVGYKLLVLTQDMIDMIDQVTPGKESIDDMPSVVLNIVQSHERLWDIGKKYHVPLQQIMETNHLVSADIKRGDRLMIIKKVH